MMAVSVNRLRYGAMGGLVLILLYCCSATLADAITRTIAQSYEAPQLFFFSGGLVAVLSVLFNRVSRSNGNLVSKRPKSLALRSGLMIASSVFYFLAFRSLVFAEVFIFIALVPIFSALFSGPVLGEPVRWQSWLALCASAAGMVLLYPEGLSMLTLAHLSAFLGALTGATSMVIARHISRDDDNALLQVLYPNLAMCAVMGCVLPFVYKPMSLTDFSLVVLYAAFLFAARWMLVLALTQIKAHVVTLLINLQFVVMVVVGMVFFGETPGINLLLGVGVVILASAYVFLEQYTRPIRSGAAQVLHGKAGSTAA